MYIIALITLTVTMTDHLPAGLTAPPSLPTPAEHARFEREWKRVAPRLSGLARRDKDVWTRAQEDADDLGQEIALVLWRRLLKTKVDDPVGLACKVAHDIGVSRRRRAALILFTELSTAGEPGEDPALDEMLDARRGDLEVEELLHEYLGQGEREAIRLRLAGCKLPEAAASMGVSKQHYKDLLKLARRRLALPLSTMRRHGRCRMVAARVDAYARGTLRPGEAAWQVAVRHLAGCSSCRRAVSSRHAARRPARA